MSPDISDPVERAFAGRRFIHGAGVAIFHVKSARVVVVHHTKEGHWFLPRGRKDVDETSIEGAEREGFEESGYRNRVLPLPHSTIQTWDPARRASDSASSRFHTEPIATEFYPMRSDIQYICSWYIAETLPPALEQRLDQESGWEASSSAGHESTAENSPPPADTETTPRLNVYAKPPASSREEPLTARMALEPQGWEPTRVERSTTQSDELHYRASLLLVSDACERLGDDTMKYVVKEGWRMVSERLRIERNRE